MGTAVAVAVGVIVGLMMITKMTITQARKHNPPKMATTPQASHDHLERIQSLSPANAVEEADVSVIVILIVWFWTTLVQPHNRRASVICRLAADVKSRR
jgi:hypothetical protein